MKEKYKECLIYTITFIVAIIIHYFLSFPVAKYTNYDQRIVFGFLATFAGIGWFTVIVSILTQKPKVNYNDLGIDKVK